MKINPRSHIGKRLNLLRKVSDFKRLSEILGGDRHGQLHVEIDIWLDAEERLILKGRARAELRAICQRCLEEMRLSVDSPLRWGLVNDGAEAKAGRLPDELEPVSLENGVLDLDHCLEDQLLLALPLILKHPLSECSRDEFYRSGPSFESAPPVGKHYPFAHLGKS